MKTLTNWLAAALILTFSAQSHAFLGFGSKKKPKPKFYIVEMALSGAYPDRGNDLSLFGSKKSYPRLLKRLKQIQEDVRVKAVIFRFGGLSVGFAKAEGIRSAIQALNKAGKMTFAMLESSTSTDFVAAMGCKKIYMTPAGMLYMPGMRAEQLYFKGLLDKLGVKADFVTVGNFKTAPEPYMKKEMSEAQRKQLNRLIGDLYNYMVEVIAAGRKLKKKDVKAAIDKGLMLPSDAKSAGLIDGTSYLNAIHKEIKATVSLRPLLLVRNYGKVKKKQPTSIWSLMSLIFSRKAPKLNPNKPKIAVVYAQGAISYGNAPDSFPGSDDGIYSNELIKTLEKVRKLKNVRAVVLRVNSPGGSALASDLIWRKLEEIKQRVPLFVSMGNVAASGGYYIAMGADMIVAQPTTITGSIGVFGGKMVLRQTMAKVGITVQSVSRGKHSGIFSTYSKFSESERASLQAMLNKIYEIFTKKAAKGRKMKHADLLKLAGGQVWTGRQAQKAGLVDRLGSLQDTIKLVIKRTGLKTKPQIVNFPRPKSFFEALQKMSSTKPATPAPYGWVRLLQRFSKIAPGKLKHLQPLFSSPTPVLMYSPVPNIVLH